jgi:hypothetical protein
MAPRTLSLAVPILIIAVGTGRLLTVQGFWPGIDWVWTLGLAIVGVLAFVVAGLTKLSVVVGPFFLATAALSVLRQSQMLGLETEAAILLIWFGVLLLIAQHPAIPAAPTQPAPVEPVADSPKKLRL